VGARFISKPVLIGALAALLVAGVLVALWTGLRQKPENLQLSTQQWREDLQFLARELPKRHANAFHFTPRERFEKAVADLDSQLEHADSDMAWVGLQRVVSLVGDAHTYLQTPQDSASDLPIDIARFGDDYRIVSVDPELENALGARVIKVGDLPVARAAELCKELFSRDENPTDSDSFVNNALTSGGTLHGLGITSNRNLVRYTLVDDTGRGFEVDARSSASEAAPVRVFQETPLYMQNPEQPFACTYLAEAGTLYCNVRTISDLRKPVAEMLRVILEKNPGKLVIDLRQNRGGDYTVGEKYLINPVGALPSINKKGHLFVLISADTFSAAMNNAAEFRTQTAALLVGQGIGEKPNSYQEPRSMTLPNSHLTVRYSTRFYRFAPDGDNAIRPDQEIAPSWADYKAGSDPVLAWVLKYSAP
jgi:Peptidase family S41